MTNRRKKWHPIIVMPKKALITGITGPDGSSLAECQLKKSYFDHGIQTTLPPPLDFRGRLIHERRDPFEHRDHKKIQPRSAPLRQAALILAITTVGALICLLKIRNIVSFWYQPLFQIYSLTAAAYVISRVLLSIFYRVPADQGLLPRISVIIAAKNEADHIDTTIHACYESRYPAGFMDVMVIDDGSTD